MKVLIADDEPLARERLAALLAECPGWELCAQAADGQEAWALCQQHEPDLLILDIRMPGLDGLELADRVATLEPPPAVIFSTAFAEHAFHAFQTVATAYLLKPITRPKLRDALAKVRAPNRLQGPARETGPMLDVGSQGRLRRIPLARVLYLRAAQKLTEIHHEEGMDLTERPLAQFAAQHPALVRIHRGILVNPARVRALQPRGGGLDLYLEGHAEPLPVSRRLAGSVRAALRDTPAASAD